ncbi:MAG: hypothetical protein SGI98_10530 [Verrucomicrobiota bacterium]|nr:hypothetical protein [Verrucomicrobiota bacterium]
MNQGDYIIIALCSIVCSFFATRASISIAHLVKIHASPNERTMHQGRIPRLGGVGIGFAVLLALMVSWFLNQDMKIIYCISSIMVLAAAGLLDDWISSKGGDNHKLPALLKLMAQMAVSIYVAIYVFHFDSVILPGFLQFKVGFLGIPLTFFWLVGMTNFFNFMDGSNGLAGGTAVIISIFSGFWCFQSGQVWAIVLCLIIGLSALGFLPFNFPRAKTFMGDCGSLVLGFSLALVSLPAAQGMMVGQLNPVLLMLIWSPFIIDSGFTLVKRVLKRENIFHAHNAHLYQRMIKSGYSHVEVALLYWNLAVFFNLLALWLYR